MSKSKRPAPGLNAVSPAGLSKSSWYKLCWFPPFSPKSQSSWSSSDPRTDTIFSAALRRKSIPAMADEVPETPYPVTVACVSAVKGLNSIAQVGTPTAGVSSVAIAMSASRKQEVGDVHDEGATERGSYQTCSTS